MVGPAVGKALEGFETALGVSRNAETPDNPVGGRCRPDQIAKLFCQIGLLKRRLDGGANRGEPSGSVVDVDAAPGEYRDGELGSQDPTNARDVLGREPSARMTPSPSFLASSIPLGPRTPRLTGSVASGGCSADICWRCTWSPSKVTSCPASRSRTVSDTSARHAIKLRGCCPTCSSQRGMPCPIPARNRLPDRRANDANSMAKYAGFRTAAGAIPSPTST